MIISIGGIFDGDDTDEALDPPMFPCHLRKKWAFNAICNSFESVRIEDTLIRICQNHEVKSPFSDGSLNSVEMAIELAFEGELSSDFSKIQHLLFDLAWELCFDYKCRKEKHEIEKIKKNAKILVDCIFEVGACKTEESQIKTLLKYYENHCGHLKVDAIEREMEKEH